jgi:hypothetical protein
MDTNNEFRAVIGTRKICYPYHVGQLQAILRYCLPYGVIPGVTITDKAALNEWVETEIEQCIQEAEQFEKEAFSPLTPTEIADVESSMDAIYEQSAKVPFKPYKPLDTEPMV